MLKWLKLFVALLLLPLCLGAGVALVRVARASGQADTMWVAALSGAACWVVIYLLLPKPMWVYVLGHELTHALWTWLFGGRVKRFKVSAAGGHVVVTRSNFLIALALTIVTGRYRRAACSGISTAHDSDSAVSFASGDGSLESSS